MADDAQFQEVLDISVDVDGFKASLAEIQQIWTDFVASFGDQAAGVVGAGMFSSLKEQLEGVREQVGLVYAEIVDGAQATSDAVASSVEATDAVQEAAAEKQRARTSANAEAELATLQAIADAEAALASGGDGADGTSTFSPKEQPVRADITAEIQGAQDQFAAAQEQKLEASYVLSEKLQALDEQRSANALRLDEEMNLERQALMDQYLEANYALSEKLQALDEERAAQAQRTDEEITIEQQALIDQQLEANYAYTDKLIVLAEERADRAQQLDEEITLEQQAALDQQLEANYAYTDKLIAMAEQRADRAQAIDEEITIAHQAALDKQNSESEGEGFGAQIARVAQFVVLWRLVSEAIGEATKLITAPFKALEDGVTYLHDLQARADELRGVLQANVKFSDDLVENFRQASQVAPLVVKALQDAAIATHTNPQQLTNIFKSLADNGAAGGVQSTQGLVDLATQLGVAFKATGASVQSVQRAISEIPKLLEGTLPHGSKLLQVLDLSSDAAAKLVKEGLTYGDLLERITALPSMTAHAKAVAAMKDDWQSAYANLKLYISRLEAAGSAGLADQLSGWLKELNEWIENNADKLSQGLSTFASVLTNVATAAARTVSALGALSGVTEGNNGPPMWLHMLGEYVNALSVSLGTAANHMQLLADLANAGKSFKGDDPLSVDHAFARKADEDKAWSDYRENMGDLMQQSQRTSAELSGKKVPQGAYFDSDGTEHDPIKAAAPHTPVDLSTHITTNHDDRTEPPPPPKYGEPAKEMADEKAQISSAVDAIKEKYKELNEATAESVASRMLSHKDAATQIKANAAKEIAEIAQQKADLDSFYDYALSKVKEMPATTPKQVQEKADAQRTLQEQKTKSATGFGVLDGTINKTGANAGREGDAETASVTEEHFKHLQAMQEEAGQKALAYDKLLASEGYLTKLQAFDRETAIAAQTHARILALDDEEIARFATNTAEKAELQDKRELDAAKGADAEKLRAQERKALQAQHDEDAIKQGAERRAQQYSAAETSSGIETSLDGGRNKPSEDAELYALKERDLSLSIQEAEAALVKASAMNQESDKTRELTKDLAALYQQREKNLQERLGQVNQGVSTLDREQSSNATLRDNVNQGISNVNNDKSKLAQFDATHDQGDALSEEMAGQRAAFVTALELSTAALVKAKADLSAAGGASFDQGAGALLGLGDASARWTTAKGQDKAEGGGGGTGYDAEIASGAQDVANAFHAVVNAAAEYEAGYKQGGVLGGAGAVMSANASAVGGFMTELGSSSGPLVGSIISAVGGIMSTIGSLFTQAAQHIATVIQQQATITMAAYQNQTVDLANTLAAMQQEETNAIASLSGVKGGQAELTKILPGLQSTIASLQQQVNSTLANFTASLESLSEQSSALTQINQQWVQINQTVADYLAAGGSAAAASQYLSYSLQQLQTTTQDTLTQAQDQAVQNAITLNGLLQQKLQLTEQYNEQVFATVNEGSIQRTAGAVEQGMQLEQITAQYASQLVNINAQISLTSQQVALESQVFNIAQNINDLHTEDATLQLTALQEQLTLYTQMQKVVAGITDTNGTYSAAPGTFNALPTTINVELSLAGYTLSPNGTLTWSGVTYGSNGGGGVTDPSGGAANADALSRVLSTMARMTPV